MPALPLTPSQLDDASRLKSLYEKWKEQRRSSKLPASQEVVAALLGFSSQSSVSQYVNGKIPLNINAALRFADLFGCHISEISPDLALDASKIAEGAAPQKAADSRADQARAIMRLASKAANEPEYVAIRKIAVRVRAGVPGFSIDQTSEEFDGEIYLAKSWLMRRGLSAEKLIATSVFGESMEPRISKDDLLLVNTADTTRAQGKLFGVNHEGEFVVKRLKRRDSKWYLFSDNPDQKQHAPVLCNEKTFIVGRVVLMQSEDV